MADNFHTLDEAAKLLNVTPEQLGEMRDNGEIRGFRDGSTWKFKTSEVQKLIDQSSAGSDSSDLGFEDEGDDEVTMLGESPDLAAMLDSIDDDDDSESSAELGAAASLLVNDSSSSASVIGDSESDSQESDLQLADDSSASADDAHVLDDSELLLQQEGGTGEIEINQQEDDFAFDSSELDDSSADMDLSDDDFALSDDDLVLSNSDSAGNSDITLGSGDSGINLTSPSDSGISLDEEPMELAGGSSSALGLPEEDSGLSLGDDLSDSEDFADLQKDDEFLLSPSDEGFGDSSDSGSQVIALSDSQAFDEDAATMIADRMFEEDPLDAGMLLEEENPMDAGEAMGLGDEMDPTLAATAVGFQQEVLAPIQAVEAPYSVWNLMGLSCVLILLVLTGISMTDVVRSMWSWQEPYEVSNSVMNMFVSLYEAIRDMVG
ncbi:MAG: helix-turn-helix domain-containing protein [Planctomycetota bacterium]|nr:helix-turn-helix domain-containing protein [Planctomycetota bacterium]